MCVSRRTRAYTWRMNLLFLIVIYGFICIVKTDNSNSGEDRDTLETSNRTLDSESHTKDASLAEIFENAHQAYLDNNWDGCIERVHDVLHGYKVYRDTVIKCRRRCRKESDDFRPIMPENIEDLHFYEKKVRETWCLMKCNQDYKEIAGGNALKKLPIKIETQLVHLEPYEYLHICYAQRSRYQDAANAVFTYLVKNPTHEMSIKALTYYLEMPGVNQKEVINLEAPPFLQMYINGVALYEEESYDEAIKHFETSLRLYVRSEEDCRFYCEGSFDQGWYPEFTSSIANHFTYCLKCKRGCSHALNNINGEYHNDLLPSHYNYLQFAYYKLGKINAACRAVASYLLFDPADEIMLKNKDYYASLPKVQEEEDFVPREEALRYVKRQEYELRILRYITEEFEVFETQFKTHKKKRTQEQPEDNTVDKLGKKTMPLKDGKSVVGLNDSMSAIELETL